MIVTCEACGTSYRLKTSMVKETGSKVRCSRCEHVFIVYPPSALAQQDAESPARGVEGTETMEFFGALEAETRATEEEARMREEGDTISDLEALIDNEGDTRPGETTGDELFSDIDSPFFSETAKSAVSLSDLETAPETAEVIPLEALAATALEESGAGSLAAESTLDMGALTTDALDESAAGMGTVLDMGNLTSETTSVPEFEPQTDIPAAEAPETEEIGFDELTAEDWTPVESLMDMEDLVSETGPAPEDAESRDTMDFAEIAREEEQAAQEGVYGLADLEDASEPSVSGMEAGEVVEMAELAVTTGVTVDFDDIAAASPPADESQMAPEAELDLEEITVSQEEEDLYGEQAAPEADWQEPEASESVRDMDAFTVIAESSDFEGFSDDLAAGNEGEDEVEEEGGEAIDLDEFKREEEAGREPAGGMEDKPTRGEKKQAAAGEEETDLSDIGFGLEEEEDADTLELEEGDTLNLDLDEDEFELDLELEDEEGEAAGGTEEEFDLNLEEVEEAAPAGVGSEPKSGPEADEEEFDLDLDFEEAGDEAAPEPESSTSDLDEFDLDFEEPPETDGSLSDTAEGEDWALDLEEFDLDLDFEEAEESSETLDLDEEEFDLDFDLEEEEPEAASEEEPEFDLDLDLDAAEEPGDSGEAGKALAPDEEKAEEFELDLDFDFEEEDEGEESRAQIETSVESAGDEVDADEFELDLDLDSEPDAEDRYDVDLTPEDSREGGEEAEDFELDLELSEEEEETPGDETLGEQWQSDKTEEFDLSEIEDFLDEESTAVSASQMPDESTELELELDGETAEQTMEADTEPETGAEDELTLETMLDEGEQRDEAEEKDLSMETREEAAVYPDAGQTPMGQGAAEEAAGQTFEEEPEEQMPSAFSAMGYKRRRSGLGRSLLIGLIVLVILGALAVGGMYYFGLEDRIPFLGQLTSEQAPTGPAEAGSAAPAPTEDEPEVPTPAEEEAAAPTGTESEPEAPVRVEEDAAATTGAEAEEPETAAEVEGTEPAEAETAATEPAADESAESVEVAEVVESAETPESGEASAAAAAEAGSMSIGITTNPDFRFVENSTAGELLVITGNVTNQYDHPRRFIKVKGSLYDPTSRQPIRSNTVVAGTVISDNGLASRDLDSIKTELSSAPEAESGAEEGLPPGQSLPFMVVFGNLPENLASFDVLVHSSTR